MALSRGAGLWRACSGPLFPAAARTQSSAARTQSSAARSQSSAARSQSSAARSQSSAARTQSSAARSQSSAAGSELPRTSLTRQPWAERPAAAPEAEQRSRHAAVVSTVNQRILQRDYGRLFAVVHFAGRQWKVTAEDLILIENHVEAECGDRIRMEKVLLVGAEDFTLLGRPLLGRDAVRVEATVIEKTESWPKVHMRFWKRHRYQRRRTIVQPQSVLRVNSIQLLPTLT